MEGDRFYCVCCGEREEDEDVERWREMERRGMREREHTYIGGGFVDVGVSLLVCGVGGGMRRRETEKRARVVERMEWIPGWMERDGN